MPPSELPATKAGRSDRGEALRRSRAADSAEKLARVKRVLFAMARSGDKITFAEVRRRADVSHAFVYSPEARAAIEEARRDPVNVASGPIELPADPHEMIARLQEVGVEVARLFTEQRVAIDRMHEIAAEGHDAVERVMALHNRFLVLLDEAQALATTALRLMAAAKEHAVYDHEVL